MSKLEEIAFTNLQFLNHKNDFLANRYSISNNSITKENDDDNNIYTFKDLEYPIFFTFHQLMNHIHSSYESRFYGKTKKELINMFNIALDTLNEYYLETEGNNKDFELLLDDLDEKVFFIEQYYRYGWCHKFPTFIKDIFTNKCHNIIKVSKEIHDIYYTTMIKPMEWSSDDDDDDDNDNDDSDNDDSDNDRDDNETSKDEYLSDDTDINSDDLNDLNENKDKDI